MRIIAGVAGGRRLVSPEGSGTRPMTDRAREALFSSLGSALVGARVLDLYAGSGALGLEALSRGAASVVFVENDQAALTALRANIELLDIGGDLEASAVESFLGTGPGAFDLVFVDPPYALSLPSVENVLALVEPGLAPGATVVLHRPSGEPEPVVPGTLELADERTYGGTGLWRFTKTEEES